MNFTELLHSFFDEPATTALGRVAGLDPAAARRALETGLPLQLDALAAQAGTPGGAHIAEAIDSLPRFESVQGALHEPDGAQNLQQAGELLMPALLGDRGGDLPRQVGEQAGVDAGGAGRLMQMSLPLLLSLLGRFGVNAGNFGSVLGGLRGTLAGGLGAAAAGVGGAVAGLTGRGLSVPGLDVTPDVGAVTPAAVNVGAGAAGLGAAGLGAAGLGAAGLAALSGPALLEWLRGQFGGKTADALGAAAGFSGGASGRAAQATLPVLLSAFMQRAGTDAGAQDLLDRSAASADLIGADGTLNTRVLTDPAETARIEGQGRGLLGSLFPNLDPVTGRLGSALGGSGASAGRLLALMAPMLLGLLGARARAGGLNAASFRGLLGGLDGHLTGLLPAGLGSLGALLGAGALTGAAATPAASASARAAAPVVTKAPVSPPPPPAPAPVTTERRGGFPWWIIPLLLLLGLGGCWLVNQNRAAPPAATGEAAASIVVTNPTSGADLPAEPFTMSGTGPANTELTISDQGQEVGKATVGADGAWSAELPAPTTGEHTYSVDGGGGRSELKVNVTDASAGSTGTDTGSTDTGAAAGTFAISEPAADATLPAGTFTLRGTGTPGQQVELFEDGTSLGKITIGEDGAWSFDVPSPAAGAHTYSVKGPDGAELGSVAATVSAPDANASAADCTKDYTLSITDGQTVNEPFRFGGVGQGKGYSVTVKRGERTIGTKDIPLDATCGWSYQSKPGAGKITYEVRPLGDAAAAPLSTVNLTVGQ